VTHLKPRSGSGMIILDINKPMEGSNTVHWREYFAQGMEMIPGITVDREIMNTFDLPRTKMIKAQREIQAKREAERQAETTTA
jgi:hypothetical protein